MKQQEGWGSRLGFVLAAAGSAVGLGNIWRFPYMIAENGGGLFILLYIVFLLVLGIPVLLAEFVIGRNAHNKAGNIIEIFKEGAPSKLYSRFTYLALIGLFLLMSYYVVISGWVLTYLLQSLLSLIDYNISQTSYYAEHFNSILNNNFLLIGSAFLMLFFTALINMKGVSKGIERSVLFLMPLLFILLILMVIRVLTLEGATKGLVYMFNFDFSNFTFKTLSAALGQAFFSLSIGLSTMVVYASYLKSKEKLISNTVMTAGLDTLVGLLAGLMVIPTLFIFGYALDSGPGLAFITLPTIFSQISFGAIFAFLFFLLLFMASLTSLVSMMEPLLVVIMDKWSLTRMKACWLLVASIFSVSILQALSFNVLSNYQIFGMNFFSLSDYVVSNILIPFGAILVCIYVAYILKEKAFDQLFVAEEDRVKHIQIARLWLGFIKFVAPVLIAFILLISLGFF